MRALSLVWIPLVLLIACASPPPVAEQLAEQAPRSEWPEAAPLAVGAATFSFTPDLLQEDVVLAAPGGVRRPSSLEGELLARAVVIQSGERVVALVTLDQWLVPPPFVRALQHRLRQVEVSGLTLDDVWVIATGSHSVDGGYWRSIWAELGPLGLYREAAERRRLIAAESALRIAMRRMQPAAMYYDEATTSTSAPPPVVRSLYNDNNNDEDDAEPQLSEATTQPRRILFRHAEHGLPIAQLVYVPAPGALLDKASHVLTGDWPAELARQIEVENPATVVCVLPGNFADVAPRAEEASMKSVREYAELVRSRLPPLAPFPFEPEEADRMVCVFALRLEGPVPAVRLPGVRGGVARVVTAPLAALYEADWVERPAPLRLLRLGVVLLAGWPSQPGALHHEALHHAATERGFRDAWTLGHTGGYWGATLPQSTYEQSRGGKAGKQTYFGSRTGDMWHEYLLAALEHLPPLEENDEDADAEEVAEETDTDPE